jgi:hypothetical protein
MITIKKNKDKTLHGTYKTKEMTLKLLLDNKKTTAENLKHKIEIFRETDDAVLTHPFKCKGDYNLRIEKDSGTYTISLTHTVNIKKENMDNIEKMLLEMIELVDDNTIPLLESSSHSNLLSNSSVSLNSLQ